MTIDLEALCSEVDSAARGVEAAIGAGATEDERSRRALAFLAERGWLGWAVPERWGGVAAAGLCAPDEVSVRALCALRRTLARHEGRAQCFGTGLTTFYPGTRIIQENE